MHVVIPDDYQDAVRQLRCFSKLQGHRVTIFNDTVRDVDALAARFADADALVLIRERTRVTRELLHRLPKLKLIAQTGKGAAHIDLTACKERGVEVAVGTGSPYAPAELTFGLILAAMRRIPEEAASLRAGRWQSTLGTTLRGRTLGIFGHGRIGSLVAGYGRAFGMNVRIGGRDAESQDSMFRDADVVSLHLRLTPETRGIVTAGHLAMMKPGALLVNTARAELIERGALEAAVNRGLRAALDVFEDEPFRGELPGNVLATPHIGYVEQDSYELYFGEAFEAIRMFADSRP